MDQEIEYLTKEKFEEFSKEMDYLKKIRRKEVAENLEYAKSLGDLSENAEYHEARDDQASIEDRISKLESILKSATIVESAHSTDIVGIGSTVVVDKDDTKKPHSFILVGSEEADMVQRKISVRSPLGEALLGKRKKDIFTISTPSGNAKYKIIDIK